MSHNRFQKKSPNSKVKSAFVQNLFKNNHKGALRDPPPPLPAIQIGLKDHSFFLHNQSISKTF